MSRGTEVDLGPDDIVSDGNPAPLLRKGHSPHFRPCPLWPNGWMDQDATWYGLVQATLCQMGTRLPPSPKGHSSQFSAHFCCSPAAGWINMPLGTEVGLGPGDIVLDGDPAPPNKGHVQHPHFSAHVCCGQTDGWIKMPFGTEVGLSLGDIV